MAKDTFYFPHDYEPTSDPKIQALLSVHGAVGYGLYWRLVEMLHSNESHTIQIKQYLLIAIAAQMKIDIDTVTLIINDLVSEFELFIKDGTIIYCDRVNRNIDKRNDIREKRVKAGKARAASAEHVLASAEQMVTDAEQNPAKERKEKEKKVNKSNYLDLPVFKEKFRLEVLSFRGKYSDDFLKDFFEYWTEPLTSNPNKCRQQSEKAWDIARRLSTWKKIENNKQPHLFQQQAPQVTHPPTRTVQDLLREREEKERLRRG